MASVVKAPIDTLRCTEAMLRAVINELDKQELLEAETPGGKSKRRKHKRIALPNVTPVLLNVQRPGEGATSFLVAPRNMSSSGMSLLTGIFMHPGANCAVTLQSLNGEQIRIGAVIKRCRFVALRLHELGIRFNTDVDLAGFIVKPEDADTQWARVGAAPRATMAIKTGELMESLRNGAPKPEIEEIIRNLANQCRDWVA